MPNSCGEKRCIKDIEFLIRYKADLNARDFENKTALIWAVIKGNIDAAKLLIRGGGADLNVKDTFGRFALMWAVYYNKTDMVSYR